MPIEFVEQPIKKSQLSEIAKGRFGNLVKAVVDIQRHVMIIGAELHADEEALLLEQGSRQQDLWGINLYPEKCGEDFLEFDSVINLRPSQDNFSRGIDNPEIRKKISEIIKLLVSE